jgi:hypothetical protein
MEGEKKLNDGIVFHMSDRSPAEGEDFFFSYPKHPYSVWVPSASCSVGTGGLLPIIVSVKA